ncbi:MAG TPA: SDR family NAD(P)-dependent oxidoreductase [Terriglobia bacterium]|nr:SDR family NAD(P)-dependent oxidoreductase [Terriglobia bacterium]
MQFNFHDQVVVITGGSRGIGAAAVRLFAQAGARVIFSYRKAAREARQLVRAARTGTGRVVAVRADVSRMADAKKLMSEATRRFGGLDILIANAGIWNARPAPIEAMGEKQWDEMMAINLKGVYSVIHCAVPIMMRRKSGRIIVVSSTAGQRGEAFHTHYGASKGGVISFVKGLSTELAPHGILVNCVAPGWVDTDMAVSVTSNPRELRSAIQTIPLRRFASAEEIAMPILFLASEMASYITGEVLNVNGGNVLCG